MKCRFLAAVICYHVVMAAGKKEPGLTKGVTVRRRVKIDNKHQQLTCSLDVSMDERLCDRAGMNSSLVLEGTICTAHDDKGDVQLLKCVGGAWETVFQGGKNQTLLSRSKRENKFMRWLKRTYTDIFDPATFTCLYMCQFKLPAEPTVTCPHVPSEVYTDRGRRSKVIVWDRVTAYGVALEIIRTQGHPPGTSFNEGLHRMTYMVKDQYSRTSSCSFEIHVKVRRCNNWHTYYMPNGYISCSDDNIYGSTCRYSCKFGYRLQGSMVSTCEKSGWTTVKPTCSAISCGQPPPVLNGRVNCDSLSYGARCNVYCPLPGYTLQGSAIVECQGSGQWTSPGTCTDVMPPRLICTSQMVVNAGPLKEPVVVNWEMAEANDNSNQAAKITSEPVSGTLMDAGVHLVIFIGVDTSGNMASCYMIVYVKVVKCSSNQLASDFSNVSCSHENVYGSTCTIGCSEDYFLEGETNRTCLENSTWTGEQSKCIGLPCLEPPDVANGNFSCERGYFYQEMCTLICQEGFQPIPPLAITCDINWTPAGSCRDVQSPEFPDGCPPDLIVAAARLGEVNYVAFSLPRVVDNSGQLLEIRSEPAPGSAFDVGLSLVTVTAVDQASNMANCSFNVKVIERSCDPPNFDPKRKLLQYHCPNSYLLGAICTMSCSNGTDLSQTITCDGNTTGHLSWTYPGDVPPSCPDVYCPKLADPENGYLDCVSIHNKKQGRGVRCRVRCHSGYWTWKAAKTYLTCIQDIGLWSGSVPNCFTTKNPKDVKVVFKVVYETANCTEDDASDSTTILEDNLINSKLDAVCPQGWTCPHAVDSVCLSDSTDQNVTSQLEVSVSVNLGNFNESIGQLSDILEEIERDVQIALILDYEKGVYNLSTIGLLSELSIPTLTYACEPGTVFTSASLSCVDCGQGYIYNNAKKTCVPCPKGTYQDQPTAFTCNQCPENTTTKSASAKSSDQCIGICLPGTKSVSKSGLAPCLPCEAGTYQNEYRATTCEFCPFGMTTSSNGSVSITDCQFYNLRLDQTNSRAGVQLNNFTSATATFMMWLHLPTGSPKMALTFNFEPSEKTTEVANFNIGDVNIYLGSEKTPIIRTWYHVTIIIDHGNATLVVDGREVRFTLLDKENISGNVLLGFTASETLKTVVVTGVQMSSSVMALKDIEDFSTSCSKRLEDNVLTVMKVDSSLITPSTCDAINNCEKNTCGDHGVCLDGSGYVTCLCDEPCYGDFCQKAPDFCDNNKCHNESVCLSKTELKKYICECNKGRKGTLCQEIAVNGVWSQWEPWEACSMSCGKGQRSRIRACDNPPPDLEGEYCTGNIQEFESCEGTQCPVKYGQWGDWSDWTCSVTCGTGIESRTRTCISLSEEDGGRCVGEDNQHRPCNTSVCPVHGQFGHWSSWSECSKTCGRGEMTRIRECDSPSASHGGLDCNMTEGQELKSCNQFACPVCTKLQGATLVLNCTEDNTTSMINCTISCNKGFQLIPPSPNQLTCGQSTNYTWSHYNKVNPTGKLPQCSKSSVPQITNFTTSVHKPDNCNGQLKAQEKFKKSLNQSLQTNICPTGSKHRCKLITQLKCPERKRSTGYWYIAVTLELDLAEDKILKENNLTDEDKENLFKDFEETGLKILKESSNIFLLTVDGSKYQGQVESVDIEVTCPEGCGFYNGYCVDCPSGTYSVGNGSCFLCQKGFYQELPLQTKCNLCPQGLTTSGIGSIYKSECQQSPPSYEDQFWWASNDEEIFNNISLHQLEKHTTNGGNQHLFTNTLIILIVISATVTAIVFITIFTYVCFRSKVKGHHETAHKKGKVHFQKNPVLNLEEDTSVVGNTYFRMSESVYDTPLLDVTQSVTLDITQEGTLDVTQEGTLDVTQEGTQEVLFNKEAGTDVVLDRVLHETVTEATMELMDSSEFKAFMAINESFEH